MIVYLTILFTRELEMKKLHFLLFIIFFLLIGCDKDFTPYNPQNAIWNISSPEAQGMNSLLLNLAFNQAGQAGFIDGLLVIRNGFLIAERYFNGFNESTPHNIKSVSKSFLSAITGIALQQGLGALLVGLRELTTGTSISTGANPPT